MFSSWLSNQAFLFSSPAFSGTQTPSSVDSFFFLRDRPTHHHKRWGDGKQNILLGWPIPLTRENVIPWLMVCVGHTLNLTMPDIDNFVWSLIFILQIIGWRWWCQQRWTDSSSFKFSGICSNHTGHCWGYRAAWRGRWNRQADWSCYKVCSRT